MFDVGTTASGRPYFVMELVKGIPIIEYCDQQQLTARKRNRPGGDGPRGGGPPGGNGPRGGGGPPAGPGIGGGPRNSGVELDPLVGLDNPCVPLRSRLLAVPGLRTRYLEHVRTIAKEAFDWNKLGPVVAQHRSLIEAEVEADTRKLESFAAFKNSVADAIEPEARPQGRGMHVRLRAFADQRRKYLLDYKEPQDKEPKAAPVGSGPSR